MLITYIVEVPEENVMELADFMQKRNIHFNHRADVAGSHPQWREDRVLMGGNAAEILEELNRHLERVGVTPGVPGPVADWSVPKLQSFLDVAACNFRWNQGRITAGISQGAWDLVVRDTPEVFGGDGE